ncbi:MAG: tRNA-dihydrouridine synthase family protein [Lachnospiraceae bacterium]|nr:tRNA-dihydrouridine synthase family protein [Lachnospiraceae bacterium]
MRVIKTISFAPMEGITGSTYRKVHREFFGGVDRYYTPFLAANKNHKFKHRETREFLPYDPCLVPQVLTGNAADFVWAAKTIAEAGYEEVNLNLGCPASTVVTKKKGAGLLADTYALECFLDEIFSASGLPKISVKTRIGFDSPKEAEYLGELYANYPFCEVVIHPRVRQDFYSGTPNLEAFTIMKDKLPCPVCYNGDIRTVADAINISKMFSDVQHIMIGRGLVADPALAEEIRVVLTDKPSGRDTNDDINKENAEDCSAQKKIGKAADGKITDGLYTSHEVHRPDNRLMLEYVDTLWNEYIAIYSGERDVLFKMKELWFHMGSMYPEYSKQLDSIKKCRHAEEYKELVRQILS